MIFSSREPLMPEDCCVFQKMDPVPCSLDRFHPQFLLNAGGFLFRLFSQNLLFLEKGLDYLL